MAARSTEPDRAVALTTSLKLSARRRHSTDTRYTGLEQHELAASTRTLGGTGAASDPLLVQVSIRNAATAGWSGVVHIELPTRLADPRFFLPGFMYGRNRGESPLRTSHEWPRLRPGRTAGPPRPAG